MLSIFLAVIVLCALAVSGCYLWSCNRGFDITDESIFYLQLQRPGDVACYPLFDFVYLSRLFKLMRQNVVAHRVLVWFCTLVPSAAFASAFHLFVSAHFATLSLDAVSVLTAFVFFTSLLRLGFGPRILYYNNLNSFAVLISLAAILALRSGSVTSALLQIGTVAFVCGLMTGFQFFFKITSSLATIPLLGLALVVPSESLSSAALTIAYCAVGFCTALGFHFLFLQTPKQWWGAFSQQLQCAKEFSWGGGVLGRHSQELIIFAKRLLKIDLWTVVGIGTANVALLALDTEQALAVFRIAVCVVLLRLFVLLSYQDVGWPDSRQLNQFTAVAFTRLMFSLVLLMLTGWMLDPQALPGATAALMQQPLETVPWLSVAVATLMLLLIPLAGAFGTSNFIFFNVVFYLPAWAAIIAVQLLYVARLAGLPWLAYPALALFAVVLSIRAIRSLIHSPYRLHTNLLTQTVPTQIGVPASTVRLDPDSHTFFEQYRNLTKGAGVEAGTDIIGLFDIPGLVFAVGAVSPGHQWYYWEGYAGTKMLAANAKQLARVPLDRLKRSIIVTHGEIDEFYRHFVELGIDFPSEYSCFGSIVWPTTGKTISLYIPR